MMISRAAAAGPQKGAGKQPLRMIDLPDRFVGSMLGLVLADALVAWHEGGPFGRFVRTAIDGGARELRWTDNTEMALGLAEHLGKYRCLDAEALAARWAATRTPSAPWQGQSSGRGAGMRPFRRMRSTASRRAGESSGRRAPLRDVLAKSPASSGGAEVRRCAPMPWEDAP